MTDTPDTYGRRGAAAGIVDLHPPRRIEPAFEAHTDALANALRRAAEPEAPQAEPQELTYLESIAKRVLYLPYGDMKELAADAMGDTEVKTPADFADRLHEWAKRVEAKAVGGAA